jgi:hypothetical protein
MHLRTQSQLTPERSHVIASQPKAGVAIHDRRVEIASLAFRLLAMTSGATFCFLQRLGYRPATRVCASVSKPRCRVPLGMTRSAGAAETRSRTSRDEPVFVLYSRKESW